MKGYFRKLSSGKWSFTLDIGINPATGRRKQTTRSGFKTKKEAQEFAAQLHYELGQGSYIKEENILFSDFAQQWLEIYNESNDVKPGTIRVRKHEISRLMPYFSKMKMNKISRTAYQKALNDLKEKGYADNTLDGVHRTGRMIFRKSVELEIIKKDPTEQTYLKKTKKSVEELEQEELPKYLEKEQLAIFLKTASSHGLDMDKEIFTVLAYSGMRIGELVALKWNDIRFDKNTVSITKTYYNPTNNTKKYELVTPKSKKSKREIVLDESVMGLLRKHMFVQRELKMLFRDTYHDQDFVFAKMGKYPGYPIYIKTIEQRMKRILHAAKLNQELTPHSLRHTHTSLLAEAGVNLELIMERLGHSDDQTTRNVYLHATKEAKKEASQKFSELMKNFMN